MQVRRIELRHYDPSRIVLPSYLRISTEKFPRHRARHAGHAFRFFASGANTRHRSRYFFFSVLSSGTALPRWPNQS